MLRKVRATIRLAPQLKTVAIEMALPRIWAGNISLRSNHDTENVSFYFGRGSAWCSMYKVVNDHKRVWKFLFSSSSVKAHSYQPKATLIPGITPTVRETTYNLIKAISNQCRRRPCTIRDLGRIFPPHISWQLYCTYSPVARRHRNLLIRLRKVKATTRFVPQLKTVETEMARPRTCDG